MSTLTTKVIATGSLVAAVVAMLSAWGTYGWVTRSAYAEDHEGASVEVQQEMILTALENNAKSLELIQIEIVKNQDQWECDETDEELNDIGIALAGDMSVIKRAEVTRTKEKLQEVWKEKRCTRFTD